MTTRKWHVRILINIGLCAVRFTRPSETDRPFAASPASGAPAPEEPGTCARALEVGALPFTFRVIEPGSCSRNSKRISSVTCGGGGLWSYSRSSPKAGRVILVECSTMIWLVWNFNVGHTDEASGFRSTRR